MKAYYIDGNTMHLDQTKPNKKGAKMHTIYDHQLFTELEKDLSWETLFDDDFYYKNPNIPVLKGHEEALKVIQRDIKKLKKESGLPV